MALGRNVLHGYQSGDESHEVISADLSVAHCPTASNHVFNFFVFFVVVGISYL